MTNRQFDENQLCPVAIGRQSAFLLLLRMQAGTYRSLAGLAYSFLFIDGPNMKHRRCAWPLLLVLLTGCGGDNDGNGDAGPPSSSAPPQGGAIAEAQSCALPDFQRDMLERVNQARATSRLCGSNSLPAVPALAWDDRLLAAAAGHAADMAANDYFSHDGRDGRTFSQRISDAGYTWSAAGENIAAGQASVAQVVDAWLDSPGHCANIMSDSFTEIGVACVRDEASTHIQYWAMSLGRPR
jgi:uncharacterized protein YkwD